MTSTAICSRILFPDNQFTWSLVDCKAKGGKNPEYFQFSSVTQSCPTACNPMNCSTPGLPVHYQLPESTQTHVHQLVMPSSHFILCHPLLLLLSIPPSIRVFSSESTLHIRWPKFWCFSFNISPTNEHPGLIPFRTDWLDLLAVQGTLNRWDVNSTVYIS